MVVNILTLFKSFCDQDKTFVPDSMSYGGNVSLFGHLLPFCFCFLKFYEGLVYAEAMPMIVISGERVGKRDHKRKVRLAFFFSLMIVTSG